MHIQVFKRGDKRRTWLIGCKKKSKNKKPPLLHQAMPREKWRKKVYDCP